MNSKYIKEDKLLILEMTEEIDHHEAEKIRRKADDEITKFMPRKVVLDFNNVSFMDSAGIGMVLGRYKMINMLGGSLEIENVSASLKKIFDMSGVTKICPIVNRESEVRSRKSEYKICNLKAKIKIRDVGAIIF